MFWVVALTAVVLSCRLVTVLAARSGRHHSQMCPA